MTLRCKPLGGLVRNANDQLLHSTFGWSYEEIDLIPDRVRLELCCTIKQFNIKVTSEKLIKDV